MLSSPSPIWATSRRLAASTSSAGTPFLATSAITARSLASSGALSAPLGKAANTTP